MLVGNGGSSCARSIIDITTWPLRIDREAQLHHALFAARLRIAGIALERGWEQWRQQALGQDLRTSSGSLAMFTAILRASSFDSIFAANRRPGQSDKKVT
jgi:hypothetical protein